jgi:two-component system, cell cycle sensor histidine kinase and response regulator CckA
LPEPGLPHRLSSKRLIAVAVMLVTAQVEAISHFGRRTPGPLLSDSAQLALGLGCILASMGAFHRSQGVARYAWRCLAISFGVWFVAQAVGVYCDLSADRSLEALDDLLFFLSLIPFGMLPFIDSEAESSRLDWLHIFDLIQVCIFWVSIYLYFSPSRWSPESALRLGPFVWTRTIAFEGLLATTFVLRALLNHSKSIRSLFWRFAIFLILSSLADSYALHPEGDLKPGGWFDLVWSALLVVPILIAGTWKCPDGDRTNTVRKSEGIVTNQWFPIIFPMFSLFLLARIDDRYIHLAPLVFAICFATFAARMLIIQAGLTRSEAQLRIDIGERTRTEHALRQSEKKYRGLFEHSPFGIFVSQPDGTIIDANTALVAMLGYNSKEELIAQNLDKDIYRSREERTSAIEKCEAMGRVQGIEVNWRTKDNGVVVVSMTGKTVRDERGRTKSYEVIVENITERQSLEKQFQQAQKMEAVGRLAGGVAHDFNNALGVITGYTQLLLPTFTSDDPRRKQVDEIGKAATRAAGLTRQLLAFSRKQVIQPVLLDLNSVVTDIDKMLRRLIGEDIDLTIVRDSKLKSVKADRGQIEQILMNLAVNARDAMPQGGKLIIETKNVELDDAYVRFHPFAKAGKYVALSVSDSGCGIPQDVQTHIFEPFFSTKEPGKGTGLGLSTVYGIVNQSNGYISLYSEVDRGTNFRIYLPQVDEPAQCAPVEIVQPLLRGTETVLLVEDESSMRDLTRECLARRGFVVLEAADGKTALEIADHHPGPIHLLLTDLIMPAMSGRELSEKVLHLRPETKLLYMSGYTRDLISQHGILDAKVALIEKPFSMDTLLTRIRGVLDASLQQPQ